MDFGLRFRGLVRQRRDDPLDQVTGLDLFRLKLAPALAGQVEDCRYQPVHFGDGRLDEVQRFGEILRALFVLALELRFGVDCSHRDGHWGRGMRQRRDAPENVASQFLQFAGEAHDVDQWRAQIVADDIGEALDLVIGLAKIGGALVDGRLEIEIAVAQPCFGLVACA